MRRLRSLIRALNNHQQPRPASHRPLRAPTYAAAVSVDQPTHKLPGALQSTGLTAEPEVDMRYHLPP
jgi:hypothetical protein